MAWSVELSRKASDDLDRLDRQVAQRILRFLYERVATADDPHLLGKAMQGQRYRTHWIYRIGDYRAVAQIRQEQVTVLVVQIGHRRDVYDRFSF